MRSVLLSMVVACGLSGCLMGVPQGGPYDDGYGGYDPGGNGYGGYGPGQVRCESTDGRTRRCSMDTSRGVQLARQLSQSPCIRGRNWDYDRGGVWVSEGCRADFVSGGYDDGSGGYGSGDGQVFRCESQDGRLRVCPVETRGGVALVRQLSGARCIQGQSWGWDPRGVWVDHGCRAEFRTGGGWGGSYPPDDGATSRTVRCESNDGRQHRCAMDVRGVRLQRQVSDARCIEGQSWGWDPGGIWVTRGCRADFTVW